MDVAGFDFSTRAVDVVTIPFAEPCFLEGERAVHTRVSLTLDRDDPTATYLYVCRVLRGAIATAVIFDGIGVAFVEHPFGPGSQRLLPMFGALIAALPRDLSFCAVSQGEWKREFTGRGNAKKDDVAERARHMGCPVEWPQDAYDAFGIAWAGRAMNLRAVERVDGPA